MHNNSARVQRRGAISDFTKNYGGTLTDFKKLPETILPNDDLDDDTTDDADNNNNTSSLLTQDIKAEEVNKLNECEEPAVIICSSSDPFPTTSSAVTNKKKNLVHQTPIKIIETISVAGGIKMKLCLIV
jgi:hypothetical protein